MSQSGRDGFVSMDAHDSLLFSDLTGDKGDWQDGALCAQVDPEIFFPDKGGSTREAKRVCSGCEVRSQCLEYALEHDERFGIWGGLSERERRRLRRRSDDYASSHSETTTRKPSSLGLKHLILLQIYQCGILRNVTVHGLMEEHSQNNACTVYSALSNLRSGGLIECVRPNNRIYSSIALTPLGRDFIERKLGATGGTPVDDSGAEVAALHLPLVSDLTPPKNLTPVTDRLLAYLSQNGPVDRPSLARIAQEIGGGRAKVYESFNQLCERNLVFAIKASMRQYQQIGLTDEGRALMDARPEETQVA